MIGRSKRFSKRVAGKKKTATERRKKNQSYLGTFNAASGELLLVASGAVDVGVARDERLGADGHFARAATEALFVPLAALVLHFLGACCDNQRSTPLTSDLSTLARDPTTAQPIYVYD